MTLEERLRNDRETEPVSKPTTSLRNNRTKSTNRTTRPLTARRCPIVIHSSDDDLEHDEHALEIVPVTNPTPNPSHVFIDSDNDDNRPLADIVKSCSPNLRLHDRGSTSDVTLDASYPPRTSPSDDDVPVSMDPHVSMPTTDIVHPSTSRAHSPESEVLIDEGHISPRRVSPLRSRRRPKRYSSDILPTDRLSKIVNRSSQPDVTPLSLNRTSNVRHKESGPRKSCESNVSPARSTILKPKNAGKISLGNLSDAEQRQVRPKKSARSSVDPSQIGPLSDHDQLSVHPRRSSRRNLTGDVLKGSTQLPQQHSNISNGAPSKSQARSKTPSKVLPDSLSCPEVVEVPVKVPARLSQQSSKVKNVTQAKSSKLISDSLSSPEVVEVPVKVSTRLSQPNSKVNAAAQTKSHVKTKTPSKSIPDALSSPEVVEVPVTKKNPLQGFPGPAGTSRRRLGRGPPWDIPSHLHDAIQIPQQPHLCESEGKILFKSKIDSDVDARLSEHRPPMRTSPRLNGTTSPPERRRNSVASSRPASSRRPRRTYSPPFRATTASTIDRPRQKTKDTMSSRDSKPEASKRRPLPPSVSPVIKKQRATQDKSRQLASIASALLRGDKSGSSTKRDSGERHARRDEGSSVVQRKQKLSPTKSSYRKYMEFCSNRQDKTGTSPKRDKTGASPKRDKTGTLAKRDICERRSKRDADTATPRRTVLERRRPLTKDLEDFAIVRRHICEKKLELARAMRNSPKKSKSVSPDAPRKRSLSDKGLTEKASRATALQGSLSPKRRPRSLPPNSRKIASSSVKSHRKPFDFFDFSVSGVPRKDTDGKPAVRKLGSCPTEKKTYQSSHRGKKGESNDNNRGRKRGRPLLRDVSDDEGFIFIPHKRTAEESPPNQSNRKKQRSSRTPLKGRIYISDSELDLEGPSTSGDLRFQYRSKRSVSPAPRARAVTEEKQEVTVVEDVAVEKRVSLVTDEGGESSPEGASAPHFEKEETLNNGKEALKNCQGSSSCSSSLREVAADIHGMHTASSEPAPRLQDGAGTVPKSSGTPLSLSKEATAGFTNYVVTSTDRAADCARSGDGLQSCFGEDVDMYNICAESKSMGGLRNEDRNNKADRSGFSKHDCDQAGAVMHCTGTSAGLNGAEKEGGGGVGKLFEYVVKSESCLESKATGDGELKEVMKTDVENRVWTGAKMAETMLDVCSSVDAMRPETAKSIESVSCGMGSTEAGDEMENGRRSSSAKTGMCDAEAVQLESVKQGIDELIAQTKEQCLVHTQLGLGTDGERVKAEAGGRVMVQLRVRRRNNALDGNASHVMLRLPRKLCE